MLRAISVKCLVVFCSCIFFAAIAEWLGQSLPKMTSIVWIIGESNVFFLLLLMVAVLGLKLAAHQVCDSIIFHAT